jgi:protein ImuB
MPVDDSAARPLPRRLAHLWLACWSTDRLRRTGAFAPERPLVTAHRVGARRLVAAACLLARRQGIEPGSRVALAQATVPELAVAPADPAGDAEALRALAGWCTRYTPSTRAEPPDGIWLDLTGCDALFGGEAALLADLRRRLHRQKLSSRVALAGSAGAAWALARYGAASETVVPPDGTRAALLPLPMEALRLPEEETTLLRRFGLRRVADLDSLPRAPLGRRLGALALLRLDQALGRVDEPLRPVAVPVLPEHSLAFAEPIGAPESLREAIVVLVNRLCVLLEEQGLGARRVSLAFDRVDGSRCWQHLALSRPARDALRLSRLLQDRLDRVDPGEGVDRMRLVAGWTEPLRPAQDRLAGHGGGELDPFRALAPLIDTLQNRLGDRRLWRSVPVESDVPERSVARQPPLDPGSASSWPAALPRPVRLFDPPQMVRVLAALPDHPPNSFIWRRHRHLVRRADGPERIAGEWWRRDSEIWAVRDYFRLEDETGRRFWVFRRGDPADERSGTLEWFLHGLF